MSRKGMIGALSLALVGSGAAMRAPSPPAGEISDVRYDVTFDAETASRRVIHVEMSFDVGDASEVALSLPAWTPGSYELDNFARNVRDVSAHEGGAPIRWDLQDYDTWRVYPTGQGRVTVAFDYEADQLDNGNAWSQTDFAFFNGTNLFFFPEGGDLGFRSRVVIHTENDWQVTTGLTSSGVAREYAAESYHELVDMPTFVGRFDLDSTQIDGKWYRLATYPEGTMADQARSVIWDQIQKVVPPMAAVFGVTPWQTYTTFMVFSPTFGGGAALEHSISHLGIYAPTFRLSPTLALITAHEIFHAWNVKRLRPADMWPYDYGRPMPTDMLWISEGITDYYANLAMLRGNVESVDAFYEDTEAKIDHTNSTPPVALEDASLSTWISPRDGTSDIYYDKGSLAGLMLDVLIRDATDNAKSLDDVMRALYQRAYMRGRGFTDDEWWAEVSEAAGGRSFKDFRDAYVDGREPYPWPDILPLIGLRMLTNSQKVARIGVSMNGADQDVRVVSVQPGSSAARAGVREGDALVSVAGIPASDSNFGLEFRAKYGNADEGTPYDIVVERGGQRLTLHTTLAFETNTASILQPDPTAAEKALRIRDGILTGTTSR
jgi:predicted metalloprotease with PDZ domain